MNAVETQSLINSEDDHSECENSTDVRLQSRSVSSNNTGSSFEEAVAATGYGAFHVRLLLLCGWAVSSDAIEILSISFVLPPATCDLQLTDQDKGWINSSVFVGMMIGGMFWGTLADIKGRKTVLLWSLTINAVGGFTSSFAQNLWPFVSCRLISGIGVGGSLPVIFSYFCEFQPKARRGSAISMLAMFWMCGNIFAAALAWIIIPLEIHLGSPTFVYSSWRLYLALCVVPSLTSVLLFILMPESPKYFLLKGKKTEALNVFRRMYCSNHRRKTPSDYTVLTLRSETTPVQSSTPRAQSVFGKFCRLVSNFVKSITAIFEPPLTSRSLVMLVIYFTLSFGFYGLFMWLPELFKRMEEYGSNPCQGHKTVDLTTHNTSAAADPCHVSRHVFFEGFLTALSNLPGNIITILIIDRVGRKLLLSGSMIVSAGCVFLLYVVESSSAGLALTCTFSGVSTVGWNAIDVLQAEVFPTHVRSTASGVLMAVGRIASIMGNVVFGQLMGLNCAVPIVIVATLLLIGGLAAIKLPNMTNRDLL